MHCYECDAVGHDTTPAVAVCRRCGAALCSAHARIGTTLLRRAGGTGGVVRAVTARRITCDTCRAAENS
ncbi:MULTISPECIES: DUF2180 family protein [unclassified Streptomyces]|uniref:DUF2180 family protein n=1 Tax=Streptomyces evansiae TaxID=3075535 RepID=A0ABD5E8J7_9ACTN|nr:MULTISPECIES: DUF2180 family protein [unclassified Streptomyces]MDT0417398.1 DUF2180 family protein [Streptomyces sp. DSM 41982]MDT0425568.1 DUF2180 family protein [Streptomyces sp. DSM 41859]NJA58312.1 DUF2180 family protein [Streptomyces sp. NEAU-H3]WEH28425.1 DUF2180 family protein [Streptomyces sp. AM 3-1-1]SCD45105.1 Uncharacterized protein GA0115246_101884 [Streptomyces sp. SolWspMP-sol7th]